MDQSTVEGLKPGKRELIEDRRIQAIRKAKYLITLIDPQLSIYNAVDVAKELLLDLQALEKRVVEYTNQTKNE